jgi:hypothetical protein
MSPLRPIAEDATVGGVAQLASRSRQNRYKGLQILRQSNYESVMTKVE